VDLIVRYAQASEPLRVPELGVHYRRGAVGQISQRENGGYNLYRIRQKFEEPAPGRRKEEGGRRNPEGSSSASSFLLPPSSFPKGRPLRVLYALWHYPHLAETYVTTEIACMRRWGVHVEVWSELDPLAPFATDVPVHRGLLPEAIRCVAPDLVHTHWLGTAFKYRALVASAGLPLTVRGHHPGDADLDQIEPLHSDPAVGRIFLFPHLAARLGPRLGKVRVAAACFDPELYHPGGEKDPRLVVRLAPARQVKDLKLFLRVAARCPNHRFVMAVCRTIGSECHEQELLAYNASLGSPVDLRVEVSHAEAAALCRAAGIYLYTVCPDQEYAMPISVSEAMGAGCHILARNLPGAAGHVGAAGQLYADEDEAVHLIRQTEAWDAERWRQVRNASIDRAYRHFVSTTVLRPVLEEWLAVAQSVSGRQG